MRRLFCLCLGVIFVLAGFSQVTFTSIFQHGVSLPTDGKTTNGTHNGTALHLGNHLDFTFGSGCFTWGLGAYLGHVSALGTSDDYKETGLAFARKYQLSPNLLQFNSSSFQSTQFLVGPVVGIHAGSLNLNLWAKGGYGMNNPGTYSVIYKEGGLADQQVYVTKKCEDKNGLAYNFGAGLSYLFSPNIGMQLGVGYTSTRTSQVNYNYDREEGITPSFFTADNNFIQASVGLLFRFNGGLRASE
jgi:opacity protein-like surface antigen